MKLYLLIPVWFSVVIHARGQEKETTNPAGGPTNHHMQPSAPAISQPDTLELVETFNEEDVPQNEYLKKALKPIRKNFKRINSIRNWSRIDKLAPWESGEGGTARFYYLKGRLEKIVSRQYGETFQKLTEYYLLKGQLSFVFEKSYRYNRPIYYDSAAMKENKDTEAFDLEKSQIIEERSYFNKGELLHQVNNQDCGTPFTRDYLAGEENRIKEEFDQLLQLQPKQ